eukprot:g3571.t1
MLASQRGITAPRWGHFELKNVGIRKYKVSTVTAWFRDIFVVKGIVCHTGYLGQTIPTSVGTFLRMHKYHFLKNCPLRKYVRVHNRKRNSYGQNSLQRKEKAEQKNIICFDSGDFALSTLRVLHERKDLGKLGVVSTRVSSKHSTLNKQDPKLKAIENFAREDNLTTHVLNRPENSYDLAQTKHKFDLTIKVLSFSYSLSPQFGISVQEPIDSSRTKYVQNRVSITEGVGIHYSKPLYDLLLYRANAALSNCGLFVLCARDQIKGKKDTDASAFANGYMTKLSILCQNQISEKKVRKYSTSLSPGQRFFSSNKDQLSPIVNSLKMNILNAVASGKRKTNIPKSMSRPLRIAVALSGGVDSTALLVLLQVLFASVRHVNNDNVAQEINRKPITALIVDHSLRVDSNIEANFTYMLHQNFAEINPIIITVGRQHYKERASNSNIQEWARSMRYELMQKVCTQHDVDVLLTAHHMDDQVETVLLRMFRGSGNYGLRGMDLSFMFKEKGIPILRPLLGHRKASLYRVCSTYKRKYILDPSNENDMFDRVRTRKALQSNDNNDRVTDHKNVWDSQGRNFNIFECMSNIANLMSVHKVYADNHVQSIINIISLEYNPKIKHIRFCMKALINAEIDYYIQIKVLKACIDKISHATYPPPNKQCNMLLERANVMSRMHAEHADAEFSTKIQNLQINICNRRYVGMETEISISPFALSPQERLRFANKEEHVICDPNNLVKELTPTNKCLENGITFGSSFKIFLSACGEYILVDHNGENIIQYECINGNFLQWRTNRKNSVWGIGSLPLDLSVNSLGVQHIEKRGMPIKYKCREKMLENSIRNCFGLYNHLHTLGGAQYWRLVGIPQLKVSFLKNFETHPASLY